MNLVPNELWNSLSFSQKSSKLWTSCSYLAVAEGYDLVFVTEDNPFEESAITCCCWAEEFCGIGFGAWGRILELVDIFSQESHRGVFAG